MKVSTFTKYIRVILVASAAALIISLALEFKTRPHQSSPVKSDVQIQIDNLSRGDLVHMNDGVTYFVFTSNTAGVALTRCMGCQIMSWRKSELDNNVSPAGIVKYKSSTWSDAFEQWLAVQYILPLSENCLSGYSSPRGFFYLFLRLDRIQKLLHFLQALLINDRDRDDLRVYFFKLGQNGFQLFLIHHIRLR